MTNGMIEYTVKVYASGDKHWYLNDKLHREDGPACDYVNGDNSWWLNGKLLTEQEHKRSTTSKPTSCSGKEVVIDGITYVLKEKENG